MKVTVMMGRVDGGRDSDAGLNQSESFSRESPLMDQLTAAEYLGLLLALQQQTEESYLYI